MLGYGSNEYESRTNFRGYMVVDSKYKHKGLGKVFYGFCSENTDGVNESNKEPRAKSSKNQKGVTLVDPIVNIQNTPLIIDSENSSTVPDREQYNGSNFLETYVAKIFSNQVIQRG